jgi:hypothetical protein
VLEAMPGVRSVRVSNPIGPARLTTGVRSCTVKKPRIIIPFVIMAGLFAAVGFGLSHRTGPAITVKGSLSPEDVRQIEQTICRKRWDLARSCLAQQVREISLVPDRRVGALQTPATNLPSRVSALSGRGCLWKDVNYGLSRTTNGWEIIAVGYE